MYLQAKKETYRETNANVASCVLRCLYVYRVVVKIEWHSAVVVYCWHCIKAVSLFVCEAKDTEIVI